MHKDSTNEKGNATMSFKISDKQLLNKYNQIWKRVEKLLKIVFDREPIDCDNDKYINSKMKIYGDSMITNFQSKKMPKKRASCKCLPIITSYQKKEKVLSSNTFWRMQIWTRKDKNDDDLEKSLSDESDNDSNDEAEFDNYESDK